MYNISDSSPGKMSHTVLCGGTIFDIDERRRGILDKSLTAKFASINQQERANNITPFVWILKHVGFEFVQVLELVLVQYDPSIRSQQYWWCKYKASPAA